MWSSVATVLTRIAENYIVCNVPSPSTIGKSEPVERAERVDYIAERLATRAAVLVRLLVKQVRSREISRTEMEVLSILRDGPHRVTELTELEGIAQPTMTLLVKRLEGRGWDRRGGLPDDGLRVRPTLRGEASAAQQT